MRILRSIVAPSTAFMAVCDSKITGCSPISAQVIRDELVGDKAIFLQQLAHQFERRPLVPPGLDQHIKNFALGIHSTPEVDQAAIDFQIDFVQMPDGVGLWPSFAQVCCDHRSEMVHPAAHGLIGHQDPTLSQQILDVTEAQGEPDIKPDRLLDNLGREAEAAIADLGHPRWLRLKSLNGKPTGDVTMPVPTITPAVAASGALIRHPPDDGLVEAEIAAFRRFWQCQSLDTGAAIFLKVAEAPNQNRSSLTATQSLEANAGGRERDGLV